jgi:hypothetical protein
MRITWTGNLALVGKINACRILVGNPKGRRPIGRPRHRWENNSTMAHK